jgi:hypothetical protein
MSAVKGRSRSGTALAELTVALVIAAVAAAIGGGLMVAAERRTRQNASVDRATQTLRDVAHVLSADIVAALPDSVAVRGDTALDLHAHVGASVACVVSGLELVLPGSATTAAIPFSFWREAPDVGDVLAVWDSTTGGRWHVTAINSVSAAIDGAGCATTTGFRTAADSVARVAVTRVRVAASFPAGVGVGAPVRVFRPVRWTLYRGSDRTWSIGYRRCPRGSCGSVQPVAGPLASAPDSGLVFSNAAPGVVGFSVRAPLVPGGSDQRIRVTAVIRGWSHAPP